MIRKVQFTVHLDGQDRDTNFFIEFDPGANDPLDDAMKRLDSLLEGKPYRVLSWVWKG